MVLTQEAFNLRMALWKLYFWSFWVFIAGFFFFPSAKMQNSFFYYILIPFFILNIQQMQWREAFKNKHFYPIAAYLTYTIISCFWSSNFTSSGLFDVISHVIYLMVFYMMVSLILQLPPIMLKKLLNLFLIVASISGAISIVMWYAHNPFNTRLFGYFRATHPILADWAYGIPAVILCYQFITQKENKKSLVALLAALPLLAFILLTQSRGPIVALAVIFTILAFTVRNKRSYTCILLLLLAVLINLPMIQRIEITVPYRAYIWTTVFKNSLQHFWFGAGYLADKSVNVTSLNLVFTHAHNIYLEAFFFGGIVGLGLLLWAIIKALLIATKNRSNPIYFVTGLTFIYGLVCVFTDGARIINNPHELWLCFWFPLFTLILLLPSLTLLVRLPQGKS